MILVKAANGRIGRSVARALVVAGLGVRAFDVDSEAAEVVRRALLDSNAFT